MVKGFQRYLKGDRYLWAFIGLLALFSFLPIYSASTNLTVNYGTGTVFSYLLKHALALFIGFIILFSTQFIDYKYFGGLSVLAMPLIFILLIITLTQRDHTEEGINTARWLHIPATSLSFQTSTVAGMTLFIYCARYLAKNKDQSISFMESFWLLIFPVLVIIMLIFPANGSTAALIFGWVAILLFLGGYPLKYLLILLLIGLSLTGIFIFIALRWGEQLPGNRVHIWKSRIENFSNSSGEESYQVKRAKTAIVLGGQLGRGPGKSALKAFLPQSSSDFIYAIIVEEYGLAGGLTLLFLYVLILLRIVIIATKVESYFGSLLVLSVGLPIIGQALINMGVAVHLLPVTGQTLPLISAGSTSIWISCLSFGIILSVSRSIQKNDLLAQDFQNSRIREEIA
ncbi:FtsW/RodA/SpoVE family cell cycle protein [Bacteroidetes bacterium endosymbiont of Geopemphigus sp.]|uniref:FtsW/RodA/SpoVE family cell cycle protein n=1 Tax=Bacteroidetes bacterium endosymbiont of Geopemphigus sp. TaxID=2047937 RepID=UPI000CD13BFF|nr:FtsW/RodA/SpoVE family cell cycle protein [Bacteroidetes bacterium endosymbiont of Geopemphigus sp.]